MLVPITHALTVISTRVESLDPKDSVSGESFFSGQSPTAPQIMIDLQQPKDPRSKWYHKYNPISRTFFWLVTNCSVGVSIVSTC